jgi:predicted permease
MSLFSWLRRRRLGLDEEDFEDEIRAHLEIAADERMAEGADPETARYASLKEFGNVPLTTEAARRVWTPRWLEASRDLAADVRHAVRTLAKRKAFSLSVVGVLALGIGLNAAVFTMLKAVAFSPLAGVEASARLDVVFAETSRGRPLRLSYPDYRVLRDHDRSFQGLMGSALARVNLGQGRGARQVWAELVSGNYFQVLGVSARLGRTLLPPDEAAPGRQPVVVISDGLWRRDFGADPDIVGRTVEVNDQPLTVVGVADPAFHGTTVVYDIEAYIPVTMGPQLGFSFGSQEKTPSAILADRGARVFFPQGRLRPGSTLAEAAAQTGALWPEMARERPLDDDISRLRVVPFWQAPDGAPTIMLPALAVLTATGLLVLMIACANIAGLVLVRGLARRGELALRLALGAPRWRIVRLLMVENLVLAAPGALLGVLLARHGIQALVGYAAWLAAPERVFFNVDVDGLVIGFAALAGCACAMVFGFVPALRSSRVDLVSVINEDASPRGASRGRLRAGLVVAQVTVSVLLLVGASLVERSLDAARRADPGFEAGPVAALAVDVGQNGYHERRGRRFYRDLLEAARAQAGVEAATLAAFTPMNFLATPSRHVEIEGHVPRRGEDLAFLYNSVGPGYFRTLRIPLLAGRAFEDQDDETAAPVAVVNETLARTFWGGAAGALGKRLRVAGGGWRTVIGVAADLKYLRIDEEPRPYVYLPFPQSYRSAMVLHIRGPAPVHEMVDQARARVAALDADMPVLYARPLTEVVAGALILFDLMASMLFVFGVVGMALAATGTYGLVSYAVQQSTHEVGIRMALGASGRAVVYGFLGRGLRLGALGAALGIAAALASSRLLGGVLFGVSAIDPTSFARALAIVLGSVAVATVLPALRAARTDPLSALRHQ